MASRPPHSLKDILAACRQKLVADGVFPEASAFWAINPERVAEVLPPSDRFVGLTFTSFDQLSESVTSDADTDNVIVVNGEIVAALFFCISVDEEGRDDALLTTSEGAMTDVEAVVNCFHNKDVMDDLGALVFNHTPTFLGIRAVGVTGKSKQLDRLDIRFQVSFNWGLTLNG